MKNYIEVYTSGLFRAFSAVAANVVVFKVVFEGDYFAYKTTFDAPATEAMKEVIDQIEILGEDFFRPKPAGWWKISDTVDVCH